MFPLIRSGSTVSLKKVPADTVRPGDIVAFHAHGGTLLHRVLEVAGSEGALMFRQKGDNSLFSSWVPAERCRGKAAWLFTAAGARLLDVPSSSLRVRALTRLSLMEASLFDRFRDSRRGKAAQSLPGLARLLGALAAGALFLPRVLVSALLCTAYPPSGEDGGNSERALLLWCLRTVAGCGPAPPRPAGIDPDLFLYEASAHGVAVQASQALHAEETRDALARSLRTRFRPLVHRSGMKALASRETLRTAAQALTAREIDFAVLKGPALALTLYGGAWERPLSDVDIFVRRRDRGKALSALEDAGFGVESTGMRGKFVNWAHFHTVLRPHREGLLPVELHWALVDRANLFTIDEDEVFDGAGLVKEGGMKFPVLSRENAFVYLCIHIMKHGILNPLGLAAGLPAEWFLAPATGNRLIWYLDLLLFLNREGEDMDWEAAGRKVRRWNVVREVTQCLEILEELIPLGAAAGAMGRLNLGTTRGGGGAPCGAAGSVRHRLALSAVRRTMRASQSLFFRPARLLFIGGLYFPPAESLRGFYRRVLPLPVGLLYFVHPFVMTGRLLGLDRRV